MTPIELDACEGHRIVFHPFNPADDRVLVCFSPQGEGKEPPGWGSAVCERNGWNHLFVGKARHTNFASLPVERFVERVAPVLRGRDVLAYGTSAGGNAALYYGGAVGARILAASPRDSRSPIDHKIPVATAIASPRGATFVHDLRQGRDSRMVEEWMRLHYPAALRINVPNSGHQSLARLKRAGTLSYLLRTFVAGERIDPERLKFPPGTAERLDDDIMEAGVAEDFGRVLALLGDDDGLILRPRFLALYLAAARQVEEAAPRRRVQRLLQAGSIDVEALGGRAARDLQAILDQ